MSKKQHARKKNKESKKESKTLVSPVIRTGLGIAFFLTGQWLLRQQGADLLKRVMKNS